MAYKRMSRSRKIYKKKRRYFRKKKYTIRKSLPEDMLNLKVHITKPLLNRTASGAGIFILPWGVYDNPYGGGDNVYSTGLAESQEFTNVRLRFQFCKIRYAKVEFNIARTEAPNTVVQWYEYEIGSDAESLPAMANITSASLSKAIDYKHRGININAPIAGKHGLSVVKARRKNGPSANAYVRTTNVELNNYGRGATIVRVGVSGFADLAQIGTVTATYWVTLKGIALD